MLSVIEIDREHDLAYILLRTELRDQPRGVARSVRVGEDIVLDLDSNGQLVGIELLNASSRLDLNSVSEGAGELIVGVKEAAALFGVEKSNFSQDYANKPQFPPPIAGLGSGRVCLRSYVERYMQNEAASRRYRKSAFNVGDLVA